MRAIGIVLTGWLLTLAGGKLGSVIGGLAGDPGMFAGAVLGGVAGIAGATELFRRWHWLAAPWDHRARFIGLIAFCLVAPLAGMARHTPVTAALLVSLIGVGMLLGGRGGLKPKA
ncbi:MAG TPA: hypothetical protein VF862_06640 [Gemmatimonadales bacterium]